MKIRTGLLITALAAALCMPLSARAAIDNTTATNVQDGDNESDTDQSGSAATGDVVGGQVVGVVSSGDVSVDATNHSEDIDVTSGDAFGENAAISLVGLFVVGRDLLVPDGGNVQHGDNQAELVQVSEAASGDAIGGQVAGVVTEAGGTADLVLANTSIDVDAETGDAEATDLSTQLVGLFIDSTVGGLVLNVGNDAVQEGNDLQFRVSLSRGGVSSLGASAADAGPAAAGAVSFSVFTTNGTTSKGDFQPPEGGGFTIQPGSSSTTVSVPTNFDQFCENTETMNLHLTDASGATIGDGVGLGKIFEAGKC